MFVERYLNICGIILLISLVYVNSAGVNDEQCENYCSNDAVCLILNNAPQCYCLPEWEGERCDIIRQIPTNYQFIPNKQFTRNNFRNVPCSYVPALCKNGGVCFLNGTKLSCQCPYLWDGARCEERSLCDGYCFNNGICEIKEGKPECTSCGERYEGIRCQTIKTTTTPEPPSTTTNLICSYLPSDFCNSGTCVIVGGKAECKCPPTHTGTECQTPIGGTQGPNPPVGPGQTNPPVGPGQTNPPVGPGQTNPPVGPGQTNPPSVNGLACSSNPCKNSRPCYNTGNTYYCFCGSQYSGNNCETNNTG